MIQGFNTFLPPGYRIECSDDPLDPNPIRVTTPTGTTTRPNINVSYVQRWGSAQEQAAEPRPILGPVPDLNDGQIEFNHAISYVNKIKTRFANQPDIYKQFLEILQTYQREQKPIGEVYEQVTVLFANSPDLLDDFKQFLPDTGNQPAYLQQQQQQEYYVNGNGPQLPPVGNFQQPLGAGEPGFAGQFAAPVPHEQFDTRKKGSVSDSYAYENNYNQEAQYLSIRGPVGAVKKAVSPALAAKNGPVVTTQPTLVPGVPEPVPPSAKSLLLLEEIGFFDKVKKAIGNKQTYNEFLKMLNLYLQDIIDKATLVQRVDLFLGDGHPDLVTWFRQFVGYDETPLSIENITFKKHQLELSLCKAYGPSYRQLPKAETYMPCSGRDEMCWEVLNDEWVGHPTWASEDLGFVAHRKNQYEEILFKIEEERLEFDYHMEANLRTIQTLETIANRIANMTPEQKAAFKLPEGLGHNSTTIYKKVLRKIYDKDRGFEVIDALHENPAVAVPVVLKRLKQKDEEWKRLQREWNKVWREMEHKVFYKSLDHLGLTFKQADKKLLTAKQLVGEISTIKVEQQNKRLHPLTPRPQEQLDYQFSDPSLLLDVLRLAEVYIFKLSNYLASDRDKLGAFFRYFVSLFFGLSSEEVDHGLQSRGRPEKPEPVNGTVENGTDSSKKRPRDTDLLRDVLKKQTKSRKDEKAESPTPQSESDHDLQDELEKSSELWIKTASSGYLLKQADPAKRDKFNLFANTTVYVFFRHLTALYQRLEEIKAMNETVGAEIRSRRVPQFARDLNLLLHQLEDAGVEIVGTKDCYQQVLALLERLMEGEIEHQWFEEALRQGYRNRAYKVYTIDKVVQLLVKHMHTMVTDLKTLEMVVLFEKDRGNATSTAKDQIMYRMQVRALMTSDENMFKIAFNDHDRLVNIQFVSLDDLTINDHENADEMYNYYVTSYVMAHPTEGVPASKINMPFSRPFLDNIDEDQCDGRVSSGLKVSVCENSYRLFFDADTHDEFTANLAYQAPKEEPRTRLDRLTALKASLEDPDVGWKRTINGQSPEAFEKRVEALFVEGSLAYAALAETKNPEEASEVSESAPKAPETAPKPHPDQTIDADSTVVQENNDTTIQQDGNDTTADDNTVNHDDTVVQDGNTETEITASGDGLELKKDE